MDAKMYHGILVQGVNPDRNRRPRIVPDTRDWNNWFWVILAVFHANPKF